MEYNSAFMTIQIKDMANFIMHVLVDFFSQIAILI